MRCMCAGTPQTPPLACRRQVCAAGVEQGACCLAGVQRCAGGRVWAAQSAGLPVCQPPAGLQAHCCQQQPPLLRTPTHPSYVCAGTFRGIVERLDYLQALGVNAVELMPVHEFNELEYYQVCLGGWVLGLCSSSF